MADVHRLFRGQNNAVPAGNIVTCLAVIDSPSTGSLNDPLCLRFTGWLHAGKHDARLSAIEIRVAGQIIGETARRFARPDIDRALHLAAGTKTGFELFASAPQLFGQGKVQVQCWARFDDNRAEVVTSTEIALITHDHRDNHYGVLARPDESRLFHRQDIYCTGPSVAEANPECLDLIKRYLPAPPADVLDVGCGLGGYGRALREAGYNWLGVEVKESDCIELTRLGLPHRRVDGKTLPLADAEFDTTICIEVLEHIADPAAFLAEVRRVTRRQLLVSVPNLELIPYLHRYMAVPWHLLEGDHKNFFTRASLGRLLRRWFERTEITCYARHPLSTPEGTPLYYHLFAVSEITR